MRIAIRTNRSCKIEDTVLKAENREDLQQLLDIFEEESSKKRLELNSKKTEVMVVSGNECPEINIFTNGNKLNGSIQILCYFNIKSPGVLY